MGHPGLDRQTGNANPVSGKAPRPRATLRQWLLLALAVAILLASVGWIAADRIVSTWQPLRDGLGVALVSVGAAAIALLASRARFYSGTIRSRLLLAFVALSLLAVVGTTIASIVVATITGERQAIARLESLAGERELRVRAWCDSLTNELRAVLGDEYSLDRARISLRLAERDEFYPFFRGAMSERLKWFILQSQQAKQFALLAKDGTVVLAAGADPADADTWDAPNVVGRSFPLMQLPFCSGAQSQALAMAALPVDDEDGAPLGAFAVAAAPGGLYSVLTDATGLGRSGKVYLMDTVGHPLSRPDGVELAGPPCAGPKSPTDPAGGVEAVTGVGAAHAAEYVDYRGVRVIGASRSLADLGAVLVVEQDLGEALSGVYVTVVVNLAIALALVVVAVLVALRITRSITRPLVHLSRTAAVISAGDLSSEAVAERDDEVGNLANAFNSMTHQLRELIGRLEERVAERTHALEQRAVQLETSAGVSREITSILNIDDLLGRVVERIRDTFGYSHVEVFLADGQGALVSRAGSGPVGKRGGRVRIDDESPNGRAARSGEALLISDWGPDESYPRDPSLPNTHSELVVPLRVANRVLGTLDVHSSQRGAFARQDALVIQGLGDQIAIAIRNADLYERSRDLAVVEERNRLARELHDSVTQSLYSLVLFAAAGRSLAHDGKVEQLERQLLDMGETAKQALREMRLQLYQLRPLELEREGLVPALRRRLDTVEKRSGVDARLTAEENLPLPTPLEDALYRITLEALNNVLKHSGASSVEVALHSEGPLVVLQVTDDGKGFDPTAVRIGGGLGLATMRERAESLGGELCIDSAPGRGTRIIVRAPVDSGSRSAPDPNQQGETR